IECTRPRGVVVQVGMGGDMPVPVQAVTTKEIDLRGAFRFHSEFATAVDWLGKGLVDVKPLISATLPFERAHEAFDLASDRARAMKVQLAF
ncbi:MAG: L-idonate 5-dehydrogenase, partial [Hyphomicrobiales bacterium]|nr:L-idonate 5-dehydrogenase [Hyphomicrobiales bacterium]